MPHGDHEKPTLYLIRHGEKPPKDADGNDQDGLSPLGLERANALPLVFGANSGYNIQCIFAEKPKADGSRSRPSETVAPLAQALNLPVNDSVSRDDASGVAKEVKAFHGPGNVLICWEHGQLADIAAAIGIAGYAEDSGWKGPVDYPDDRFDLIWCVPPPWTEIAEVRSENVSALVDKSPTQ